MRRAGWFLPCLSLMLAGHASTAFAATPNEIDPEHTMGPAYNQQSSPAVCFDGSNFLVTWTDGRAGLYAVAGALVAPHGVIVDSTNFLYPMLGESPVMAHDGSHTWLLSHGENRAVRVLVCGASARRNCHPGAACCRRLRGPQRARLRSQRGLGGLQPGGHLVRRSGPTWTGARLDPQVRLRRTHPGGAPAWLARLGRGQRRAGRTGRHDSRPVCANHPPPGCGGHRASRLPSVGSDSWSLGEKRAPRMLRRASCACA